MFFPSTRAERDVDTVTFFPTVVPFPKVSTDDFLRQAATDIITILTEPPSSTTPTLEAGDSTRNALLKIAKTLKRAEKLPEPSPKPSEKSLFEQSDDRHPITPPFEAGDDERNALLKSTPTQKRTEKITEPSSKPSKNPQFDKTDAIHPRVGLHSRDHASVPRVQETPTNKEKWKKGVQRLPQHRYNLRNKGTNFKDKAAKYLLAQHIFNQPTAMHMYDDQGEKLSMDNLIQGEHKDRWVKALSNEWDRLAQGNKHGVLATNTIKFIQPSQVPNDRKITYVSFVCDHRPLKTEPWRVRLVVGGDRLPYEEDAGSPASNLVETKILLNSTISDAKNGAKFMSCDLKDFFLASPMAKSEYMKVPIKYFPPDIIAQYKLDGLVKNGYVYIEVMKGMYGLKQAAVLAYYQLATHLRTAGYQQIMGNIFLRRIARLGEVGNNYGLFKKSYTILFHMIYHTICKVSSVFYCKHTINPFT